MVFRKLDTKDNKYVMEFLSEEPEFNLFIIGDIENFGYNSDFQTLWGVIDEDNHVHGVLLKFYSSFIPYTRRPELLKKFAPLISLGAKILSGKKDIVDGVLTYIDRDIKNEKHQYFASMDQVNTGLDLNKQYDIKRANLDDVDRIIDFRKSIKEFSDIPVNRDALVQKLKQGSGRVYFIENDQGKIIASASTSAENSFSAMVVGVATLAGYRKQGLATHCVYKLCKDLLDENKKTMSFFMTIQKPVEFTGGSVSGR